MQYTRKHPIPHQQIALLHQVTVSIFFVTVSIVHIQQFNKTTLHNKRPASNPSRSRSPCPSRMLIARIQIKLFRSGSAPAVRDCVRTGCRRRRAASLSSTIMLQTTQLGQSADARARSRRLFQTMCIMRPQFGRQPYGLCARRLRGCPGNGRHWNARTFAAS